MNISYEQEQFRTEKPTLLGRGIERLTHPFGKALARVIPTSTVEAVLKGLDWAGGAPQLVRFEHDISDIEACQRAAERVVRAARAISAATGAAAGFGGVLSMSLDFPATVVVALRLIRDTGRAYGYEGNGPAENLFRLQILELSASDEPKERKAKIARLEKTIGPDGALLHADHEEIAPIVDQAVERVSRAIALASFRNRAGMIVPVAGSLVGGLVNSSFQKDVSRAARFAFQERRRKESNAA